MSSNSNTKQYFIKRVVALKDAGGGHTCHTAQLEKGDNSIIDSSIKIDRPVTFIIAHSPKNNVLVEMDDGYGTEDIRTLWGSGNLEKKTGNCIGRKMEGNFASDMFFSPDKIHYLSKNPQHEIKLKYAWLDMKGIYEILAKENDIKKADEMAEDKITIQQDKNLTQLHPQFAKEVFDLINENPEITSWLQDPSKSGCMTIKQGSIDNAKFNSLGRELPKNIANMELFNYNEYLKRGSKIKFINLDTNETIEYNSETASKMHILGKDSIIKRENDDMVDDETSTYTPDFGRVNLKKIHCLEISSYIKKPISTNGDNESDITRLVYYKNFNKAFKFNKESMELKCIPLEQYLEQCNILKENGYKDEKCRCYISCLSANERKEQMKSISVGIEELRKLSIFTNTGNGVRGLCRVDYPASWSGIHLRNLTDITAAIVIDGESEATIIYSAVKSFAKLDTFNPEFLSVLGNTIVPIIKQYDNKNQPHRNGEDNIRGQGQKRRFLEPFGIRFTAAITPNPNPIIVEPKPEPKPRAESLIKTEVVDILNIMSPEDIERNKKNFDEIIKGSLRHLSPQQKYELLKIQLGMMHIEYNPIIKDGHRLNV
jgi:hypothetical protein